MKMPDCKKLLVVDDQESYLIFLRTILDHNGYKVFTAGSVKEAFLIFQQIKPDLVITDWIMPEEKGDHLVELLNGQEHLCPLLLMSGYPLSDEQRGAFHDMGVHFWAKSADYEELLTMITDIFLAASQPRDSQPPV